jgi:hypothetical protein
MYGIKHCIAYKDKNGIHEMWIGVTTEIHEQNCS